MFYKRKERSEFFLPSFGAHIPSVPKGLEYEQVLYPVPAYTSTGFDLEYTSLLLVDGLVMDQCAYEFISDRSRPEFSEMLTTVRKLMDAGHLRLENFALHAAALRPPMQLLVDECLEYPAEWLKAARMQWVIFEPIGKRNIERLGKRVDAEREGIHFGVHCFLKSVSDKFSLKEALRLQSILHSRREHYNLQQWSEIKGIIRPMIEQAVFNRLLSRKLGIPFLDWEDLEPFHRRLSLQPVPPRNFRAPEKEHVDACRHVFTVALPKLKPSSVDEAIRFMKRKTAVQSLRQELHRSIYSGSQFDQKWADSIRDDANLAQITYRRRQQRFHWISSALKFVPVAGRILEHVPKAVESTMSILENAVDITADEKIGRHGLSRYEWYYTMLEIKNSQRGPEPAPHTPAPQ